MSHKTATRALVLIRAERCKACGWCVRHCPRGLLRPADSVNARGFHPVELVDPEGCTGCGQCAMVCPDVCIEVYRRRRAELEEEA